MIKPYLRVVVTNKCNYNCYFCHKEGFNNSSIKNLKFENILALSRLAKKYNIQKIRITGGEPLLRKDIFSIIKKIFKLNPNIDLSLTTNGYYLGEYAESLFSAGIKRINVSLVSLNKNTYKQITGVDGLSRVIKGIKKAKKIGIDISLNVVITKQNSMEIKKFITFCNEKNINLRFLDLLPTNTISKKSMVSLPEINKLIEKVSCKPNKRWINNTLVNSYKMKKIRIMTKIKNFGKKCISCVNKDMCGEGIYALRLNPDGKLQPCLYKKEAILNFEGLDFDNKEKNFIEALKITGE